MERYNGIPYYRSRVHPKRRETHAPNVLGRRLGTSHGCPASTMHRPTQRFAVILLLLERILIVDLCFVVPSKDDNAMCDGLFSHARCIVPRSFRTYNPDKELRVSKYYA